MISNQRPSRKHDRVPFGARVELWKYRSPTLVRAADLSASGIFLRTLEEVAEGSYLTIRIPLPGQRPFSAVCRVARTQSGRAPLKARGLGLSFVDISPGDRGRIARYVEERGRSGRPSLSL